ncbi:MAG TPA: HlyD family efflux transporter periplasmic adaptor subunit [Oscillospiraceae bacterium]|nr:HlyD family efflux transporter periplasmic adaptor subunit [Oscillospiraceae bacterium]
MKTAVGKILVIIMSLFLIAYAGYQAWKFFYHPYETEIAVSYSVNNTLRVQGIAVRTETPIESEYAGSVSYVYEDGARVLKNTSIAYTHSSADTVNRMERAAVLEKEIDRLEEADSAGSQVYGVSDLLNQQLGTALISYSAAASQQLLDGFSGCRDDLLTLINKKQILTGEVADFSDRIELLKSEYDELNTKIQADVGESVLSPMTGYFISTVDGYEEKVNRESLLEMSVSGIEDLIAGSATYVGSAVGKIADSYEWDYAVTMDAADADGFYVGKEVQAAFDGTSDSSVTLKVIQIVEDDSSDQCAVIFSCASFTPELASLRKVGAELTLAFYNGLRISDSAVRFNADQEKGIYVIDRGTVVFKTINVIYEGPGYVICKWERGVTTAIQLFDEVVIEGSDLYVGKVVS